MAPCVPLFVYEMGGGGVNVAWSPMADDTTPELEPGTYEEFDAKDDPDAGVLAAAKLASRFTEFEVSP